MVGGGYVMITGDVSANAVLASLPYGLGVMSILIGKHIDQADFDASRGIRTLPVLIGDRAARVLNIVTIVAIYATVAVLIMSGRLRACEYIDAPGKRQRWSSVIRETKQSRAFRR